MSNKNKKISVYKGNVSVYKDNVSVYKGNVSVYKGNVSVYKGNVSVYKGNVSVCKSNVSVYKGNVSVCKGNVSVYKGNVSVKLRISVIFILLSIKYFRDFCCLCFYKQLINATLLLQANFVTNYYLCGRRQVGYFKIFPLLKK
ncbi:MAG: hypothetical protein EAZ44_08935 [Cytophagia bacterium]|nr:MAG: hypothetical protein EAZ44_08935 [Cytophagia bacterium]TAG37915.1 MAG: hypothetical protein EAZ31_10985 [Cytophagia bacterium]